MGALVFVFMFVSLSVLFRSTESERERGRPRAHPAMPCMVTLEGRGFGRELEVARKSPTRRAGLEPCSRPVAPPADASLVHAMRLIGRGNSPVVGAWCKRFPAYEMRHGDGCIQPRPQSALRRPGRAPMLPRSDRARCSSDSSSGSRRHPVANCRRVRSTMATAWAGASVGGEGTVSRTRAGGAEAHATRGRRSTGTAAWPDVGGGTRGWATRTAGLGAAAGRSSEALTGGGPCSGLGEILGRASAAVKLATSAARTGHIAGAASPVSGSLRRSGPTVRPARGGTSVHRPGAGARSRQRQYGRRPIATRDSQWRSTPGSRTLAALAPPRPHHELV